jgi:hypothetical protein
MLLLNWVVMFIFPKIIGNANELALLSLLYLLNLCIISSKITDPGIDIRVI